MPEDNRRAYREMLLTTPNLSDHISGAILYDETLRQSTRPACRSPRSCSTTAFCRASRSTRARTRSPASRAKLVTEGLDGLRERLQEYARLGAKIRQVARGHHDRRRHAELAPVSKRTASRSRCYAALPGNGHRADGRAGSAMDGSHDLEVCYDVTEVTLRSLFASLYEQNVMLEARS